MATAKRREAWDHTASLAAVLFNTRFGVKRGDLVDPLDLHPMRQAPPPPVVRGEPARKRLRAAFGG